MGKSFHVVIGQQAGHRVQIRLIDQFGGVDSPSDLASITPQLSRFVGAPDAGRVTSAGARSKGCDDLPVDGLGKRHYARLSPPRKHVLKSPAEGRSSSWKNTAQDPLTRIWVGPRARYHVQQSAIACEIGGGTLAKQPGLECKPAARHCVFGSGGLAGLWIRRLEPASDYMRWSREGLAASHQFAIHWGSRLVSLAWPRRA